MLSICLHLLWESESARRPLYLRTRVSTFPKEREECRQAATLYDGFQPVPAVSAAGPATLSIQEPSAEASGSSPYHQHPARNSLPYGCADSVRLRITGTTRETLTEPEQVRPGEESGTAHTHPSLHPASSEQTLLRSSGVMSAPPSAPLPAIRQQSSSQPTHHASCYQSLLEACCRSPQRGQRYPDVRQPAPQSATHSGWFEGGRCALTDASSPLPSSPAYPVFFLRMLAYQLGKLFLCKIHKVYSFFSFVSFCFYKSKKSVDFFYSPISDTLFGTVSTYAIMDVSRMDCLRKNFVI